MRIIQIIGKIGAGKSYLSSLLTNSLVCNGYTIYRISFATPLKKILNNVGVSKNYALNNKNFEIFNNTDYTLKKKHEIFNKTLTKSIIDTMYSYLKRLDLNILQLIEYIENQIIENKNIEIGFQKYFIEKKYDIGWRILAQNVGSILRNINENIFVDYVKDVIRKLDEKIIDYIIIDDTRFPNEILDNSFKIKIMATNDNKKDKTIIFNHESEKYIDKLPFDLLVLRKNNEYEPEYDTILAKVLSLE